MPVRASRLNTIPAPISMTNENSISSAENSASASSTVSELLPLELLTAVFDVVPDAIYLLDKDGRITWMNERAEADNLLMLSGRNFLEFIADDCRQLAMENLRRTLAGQDAEYEVRAVRTDGTILDAEAHTYPLWKDGE